MGIALVISILFSWAVGIAAARNRRAERIILPVLDVLQSIPILGFFPVVLVLFVRYLPLQVGVNLSVIFLIFTSMAWNIAFGVYESVKSIPNDYLDLARLERLGLWKRVTTLYIPATWAKVAYNSVTSWSVGLFYLISSEIFSLGSSSYAVSHGIGVDIALYASKSDWNDYTSAIVVLVLAVLLTRVFFLSEFSNWAEKFKLGEDARPPKRDPIYRVYSWFSTTARMRLFSSLSRINVRRIPRVRIEVGERIAQRISRHSRLMYTLAMILFFSLVIFAFVSVILVQSYGIDLNIMLSDESIVLLALVFSFARVWYVYLITAIVSLPLAIIIATRRTLLNIMMPVLQIVSAIPAPALLPPVALALGSFYFGGELTAAFVIFLGMFWYLLFNIMAGVRTIPSDVKEMARLAGLKGFSAWRHVYIPAALPSFVTGSITAVGGAWNTLIVAEYFSVSVSGISTSQPLTQVSIGIGKLIDVATAKGDLLLLGLSIFSMSALVITFNILVWRRLYARTTKRYAYGKV